MFAGAFRSHVQPVEIAKALARRMDDGRVVGVGRVYAPVAFAVDLSADDADNLGDFRDVLAGELSTYLTNHAREQGYHLASKPSVAFRTDEGLKLGRFRASAELAPRPPDGTPSGEAEPAAGPAGLATVTVGDTHHDITLAADRVTVGRLADCDIRIDDANASREHAEFVREGSSWFVRDLGSTNGTRVNGERVERAELSEGDVVTVGVTSLVFHEHRSRP